MLILDLYSMIQIPIFDINLSYTNKGLVSAFDLTIKNRNFDVIDFK